MIHTTVKCYLCPTVMPAVLPVDDPRFLPLCDACLDEVQKMTDGERWALTLKYKMSFPSN